MHPQKIELALPAQLDLSLFLRDVSQDVFEHAGFSPAWVNRLKLVLDELFNNAVRYGSGEESKVHITFLMELESLAFQVEDEGKGNESITAEALQKKIESNMRKMEETDKDSGRGLALIAGLWADDLKIKKSQHGGILIEFKKRVIRQDLDCVPQLPLEEAGMNELIQLISLEGGINTFNFEEKTQPIEDMIEQLPEKGVLILDCAALEYFNSTFIGQLSTWHKKARKKGAHLLMKNTNPETTKILNLVGLNPMIYSHE